MPAIVSSPSSASSSVKERPVTLVEHGGTNVVLGAAPERIAEVPALLREAVGRETQVPPDQCARPAE
jgi:hypothetical protein